MPFGGLGNFARTVEKKISLVLFSPLFPNSFPLNHLQNIRTSTVRTNAQ